MNSCLIRILIAILAWCVFEFAKLFIPKMIFNSVLMVLIVIWATQGGGGWEREQKQFTQQNNNWLESLVSMIFSPYCFSMLKKTPTGQLLVRFATQVNSTTGFSGKRKNGESTSILDSRRPIASD